jgi:hypothetical protein
MHDTVLQGPRIHPALVNEIDDLKRTLIGAAVCMSFDDEAFRMHKGAALWDEIRAGNDRVKGNRPATQMITFQDMRVMMANTLRTIADFLDTVDLTPAPASDRDD